tara:strand:+ start:1104 stop:1277 length:174 start_codon:yes stop_codon:yes gene_type:complete
MKRTIQLLVLITYISNICAQITIQEMIDLARSVDENTKGSLLYIYDDGSVEKKYLVK